MENFEFIKKYDEGVYNEIIKAEEKAKTEPTLAAFQTRKALEALVKYICTQQKINVIGSNIKEAPSLDNYIFSIKNKKIFEYKTCDKIYKIKDRGNKVTHYQENRPDLVSEDEIELLSYLHEIICEYLKKYKSVYIRQKFNKDHIHIGKLEVVNVLSNKDSIAEKEFICIDSKNNKMNYCIVRQFRKNKDNSSEVIIRDDIVLNEGMSNDMENIVKLRNIETAESNDLRFVGYYIDKNYQTLADLKIETMNFHERISIIKQIANGLYHLHNNNPQIVHRRLTNDAIFITDKGNSKYVKIGKFEFSKVFEDRGTVSIDLKKNLKNLTEIDSIAPEIVNGEDSKNITAAADIYSLGVFLYRIIGADETKLKELDKLEKFNVSKQDINTLEKTVSRIPSERPNISDVLEILNRL